MYRLTLLALILVLSSFTPGSDPEKALPWDENNLRWDHFSERDTGTGNQQAFSYVGVSYSVSQVNGRPAISYTAWFDLASSWVVRGQANAAQLLHEQRLFDLAELHARKMRKRMSSWIEAQGAAIRMGAATEQARAIYQEGINALFQQIQQYNVETNNGKNAQAQARWNKLIQAELTKLELFRVLSDKELSDR